MSNPNVAEMMTGWQLWRSLARDWWHRVVLRHLPRLVWIGQEIDVCVTFSEDPLRQDDPWRTFYRGALPEIERRLNEIGIEFDKGQGFNGRDWEWDWSLRGPIHVTFRGGAKKPELRTSHPRHHLVA